MALPLKDAKFAQALLDSLAEQTALSHELLFYSTFAHKTFLVMQREGSGAEGFARLQQSFSDAVERVRAIVRKAGEKGFSHAGELTEISPHAMSKLMDLMHDLAIIKQSKT